MLLSPKSLDRKPLNAKHFNLDEVGHLIEYTELMAVLGLTTVPSPSTLGAWLF
jgi:hypothetical protein